MPKNPDHNEAMEASPETPPPKEKHKPSNGAPATKAEQAAAKRIDKTEIKRMRKR